VNKTDQHGLQRFVFNWAGATWYCLPTIRFDSSRVTARKATFTGRTDKETAMREYYRLLSLEDSYEAGHRDPNKPASDDNIVMQPASLNGGWRDRYKLDEHGFPCAHNTEFLKKEPASLLKTYSKEELISLGESVMRALAL
jgi:hypothetical protein